MLGIYYLAKLGKTKEALKLSIAYLIGFTSLFYIYKNMKEFLNTNKIFYLIVTGLLWSATYIIIKYLTLE